MGLICRVMCAGLVVGCVAALGGCLVSSSNNTSITGAYVSPASYDQVEAGTTKMDWVEGAFGAPTSKTTLADGQELWRWTYTKTKDGHGSVLFIFGGSDHTETIGHVNIQCKDGLVLQKWRD